MNHLYDPMWQFIIENWFHDGDRRISDEIPAAFFFYDEERGDYQPCDSHLIEAVETLISRGEVVLRGERYDFATEEEIAEFQENRDTFKQAS